MPKYKFKNIDKNQPDIVKALRKIPGVTVELDHDDILVGHRGRTYWYELKSERAFRKDGALYPGELTPAEQQRLETFTGHYKVVGSLDQILADMGIDPGVTKK